MTDFTLACVCWNLCAWNSVRLLPKRERTRHREAEGENDECVSSDFEHLHIWRFESRTHPLVPQTHHSFVLSPPLTYSFNAFHDSPTAAKDTGGVIYSRLPVCDAMVLYWFLQVNKPKLPVSIIFFSLMLKFPLIHKWSFKKTIQLLVFSENYTANHFTVFPLQRQSHATMTQPLCQSLFF